MLHKLFVITFTLIVAILIQLAYSKAVNNPLKGVGGGDDDDDKHCEHDKVDWIFKEGVPLNGTSWPEIDPTVLLGIVDAIRNGDLFSEIMAGFRRIFSGIDMGRSWFQKNNLTNATFDEALKNINRTFFL